MNYRTPKTLCSRRSEYGSSEISSCSWDIVPEQMKPISLVLKGRQSPVLMPVLPLRMPLLASACATGHEESNHGKQMGYWHGITTRQRIAEADGGWHEDELSALRAEVYRNVHI